MRIFKRIVLVILTALAIVLIVAAFLPKKFNYKRSIVINKPKIEVWNYVKMIKNQDNYGKWQLMDPNMTKSYTGEDGTVGFVYAWDSKNSDLGKGTQTITKIAEGDSLQTSLEFGFGLPMTSVLATAESGINSTKVTWSINGTSPYPFNLLMFFYDMGKDFETGLNNLKKILEK